MLLVEFGIAGMAEILALTIIGSPSTGVLLRIWRRSGRSPRIRMMGRMRFDWVLRRVGAACDWFSGSFD